MGVDVEGSELQVLKGLSQLIETISFEYHPCYVDAAVKCTIHLSSIAAYRYNYCIGESPILSLPKWVTAEELCDALTSIPDKTQYGDVYATSSTKWL